MKKILSLTLVLFIMSGLFAENKLTRYAIKSGFVKYELTGSTIGSKTIYWDDFGEKSRTEIESTTEIKVFGIGKTTNEHQVTITVKDKFWNNDLIKNEASSGTLPYYKDINDEAENMTEAEQEEYADELLASLGGEQVGSEEFMGYNCKIVKLLGAKSWIYKGITLKIEANIMGIINNETAVEFKPNSHVSASKFKPAKDVEFEDMDEKTQHAFSGFGDVMDKAQRNYEEEKSNSDDNYDEEVIPLSYDFEDFQKAVNNFEMDGYRNLMGTRSVDGQYIAAFNRGFSKSIMIMATSSENIGENDEQFEKYDEFKHKGKKCRYGDIEGEDGTMLLVEFPKHDMFIFITSMPAKDKNALLDIFDMLKF